MKIKTLTIIICGTAFMFGCATTSQTPAMLQEQDQFLNSAKSNLANNNPIQAVADTNQALAINSNNAQAYALQAAGYQQLNNYDRADQAFKKSLMIESTNTLYRTSYANFLCNNGGYSDAESQYQLAVDTENNKSPQTPEASQRVAQIYNSAGECSIKQNNLDDAIANYESSINTKNAPQQAYVGITQAYLAQGNFPKAALYISSYPGNEETIEILQLKIRALTGLMNSNYQMSDSNRNLLKEKINTLSQKLITMQQNNSSTVATSPDDKSMIHATLADGSVVAASSSISTSSAQQNNPTKVISVRSAAPSSTNTKPSAASPSMNDDSGSMSAPNTKPTTNGNFVANTAPLNSRIKKASNGHRYIIIERGDTLFNVSQKSGVSQSKLIEINHLKNQFVPLGTKLFLD